MKNAGDIQLLNGGQITNIRIDNVVSDPVSPVKGQMWFNTTLNVFKGYDGTATTQFASGGALTAYLSLTGGTLTGPLILAADPTVALGAATKQYVDTGLTGKQATLTGAATTIATANLTASRVLVSDGSGKVAVSTVTSTDVANVSGLTSNAQTQIDGKLSLTGGTLTGNLALGTNKVTSSAVPTTANDLTNRAYVDSFIPSKNWQEDVLGTQIDNTLNPGTTHTTGDRYIITNAASLHVNFGTIAGVANNDIVSWNGTAFVVAYAVSAAGTEAQGTLAWDRGTGTFMRFFGSWSAFGGLSGTTAGIGLSSSAGVLNVNLGAGIVELPTDEIGIDILASGGLMLTTDGTTSSTATGAQLSLMLDGSTLSKSGLGLKVADGGVTATQLAASVAGDGLIGGAGTALAVGAGSGISVTPNAIAFDTTFGDARYLTKTGGTLTGQLILSADPIANLGAATKQYVDAAVGGAAGLTTVNARINAGYFLYTSVAPATAHTVTHNMNRKYVQVSVVDASDQVIIPQSITFDSVNALTVTVNASIDVKVIVTGVQP